MPINRVSYDFENIRIDLGGAEAIGATSISYGNAVESEKEYGADREAFDATEGTIEATDAEITLKEYEYRNLIERLGPGYMTKAKRFDVSVTYANEGEPTYSDTLQRCRIIEDAHDAQQGPDGLEVSITVQVMKCLKGTASGQIDPAIVG